MKEEIRVNSETGGAKGYKIADYSKSPPDAGFAVAVRNGYGSLKYDEPEDGTGLKASNWAKGVPFSAYISAAMRHFKEWEGRRDIDYEMVEYMAERGYNISELMGGEQHLAAVAWHIEKLLHMMINYEHYSHLDDRGMIAFGKKHEDTDKEDYGFVAEDDPFGWPTETNKKDCWNPPGSDTEYQIWNPEIEKEKFEQVIDYGQYEVDRRVTCDNYIQYKTIATENNEQITAPGGFCSQSSEMSNWRKQVPRHLWEKLDLDIADLTPEDSYFDEYDLCDGLVYGEDPTYLPEDYEEDENFIRYLVCKDSAGNKCEWGLPENTHHISYPFWKFYYKDHGSPGKGWCWFDFETNESRCICEGSN